MTRKEFLGRYVFLRKCVGCGALLSYEERAEAFCPKCRERFEQEKLRECPSCGGVMRECRCMPKPMADEGIVVLRRLASYEIDRDDVSRRGILFLKDNRNRRVAGFFASQLSYAVREETALLSIAPEDIAVCALPRGRKARLAHGHDQAELVALSLAECLGVRYLPLLLRSREELGAQKTRNASERLRAARKMFLLDEDVRRDCEGKTVILVDDIVTTGSGMAAAAALCRKAGVRFVLAFALSTSPTQRKSKATK